MTLRSIVLSAALMLTATAATAQSLSDNQRLLGYTLTDNIDVRGAMFGDEGTYAIGAALFPTTLQSYKGCRVVGIRLAAAVNLGRTRIFLYNFTGTAFDQLVGQNQRIYEGWNNVFFNGDGYEISGDETLFYGFDYTETAEMVASETGGICGVGDDTDGAFYIYGNYGQGEGLYPISGVGKLCVQLIVDVSNLPRQAMNLTYLDTGFKYKQPGEHIDVLTMYRNTGRDTIRSCRLAWQLDDRQPVYIEKTDTVVSGEQATATFTVPLPEDLPTGNHSLAVFISEIEGSSQPTTDQSGLSSRFAVYRESVERSQVYMEIYTDQSSAYSAMLNNAVAAIGNDRVAVVNVHRPDTPLSIEESAYLCDLYAYTYPSFTVNRAYFPGEPYIAYDMNDYLPVFPLDMSAAILSDIVMQDLYSPSFATVALQGSYDADTRQLSISATGQLLPEAGAIYDQLALTLLIVENDVKSRQAVYNSNTGRTTNNQNYKHQHVLRGFMTPPTGTPVETVGDSYTVSCTAEVYQDWNPDNLQVVALLTKAADAVTDDNVFDMDVVNCASISLADIIATQGIATVGHDPLTLNRSYDLQGRQCNTVARRSLCIERRPDGTVRKVMKGR